MTDAIKLFIKKTAIQCRVVTVTSWLKPRTKQNKKGKVNSEGPLAPLGQNFISKPELSVKPQII
jgi:hypothetical protein